ncbi:MAG: transposase [Planctomycetes bacterium]|nr:transposase [Planctomycetota bacterium]
MTLPRRVLAGRVVMVTRRCSQRQLLLRPDPVVEQVVTYCLALAAERFGVEVFCVVVLGNHFHMGCVDPRQELPRFMELFDSLVARALNAHRRRRENFWSPDRYSAVTLGDADAVLERLVYMICNPVAAGLVKAPEQWPGLITVPGDLGRRDLVARRPGFFFRQPAKPDEVGGERRARRGASRRVLPDEVRLRLARPPGFDELSEDGLRELVASRVAERVAELVAARRGRFLGRAAVLRQRPDGTPGSSEPGFGLNPRVACRDRWRRAELLQDLADFWRDHREASIRFRAGERGVLFPAGTYGYRVLFGVRCRPSSAAA